MNLIARVAKASNQVRPWPYPFKAALAVSNDVDYCRFDFFDEFMKFCNTTEPTRFGYGLGLPMTSSFFGYSNPARQFGYFAGTSHDAPESPAAGRIGEYLRAGWLDANHAYGDFDAVGGFTRAHAERYFDIVRRHGGDTRVFINHGDSCNTQCVGPGAPHHDGDRPGSPSYHADLLGDHQPAYVTTSLQAIGGVTDPPSGGPSGSEKRYGGLFGGRRRRKVETDLLLGSDVLQDGSSVRVFRRLRGTGYNAPNLSSLTYQVRLIDFDALYAVGGVVVLYQHWGVLHREARRCVSATIEDVSAHAVLLAGLRILSREYQEGRLWVSGLQRLLDYALMISSIDLVPTPEPGVWDVHCNIPVVQPERFVQGLTVYVDPAVRTQLLVGGKALPIVWNGPDETGRYSVTVLGTAPQSIW